MPRQVSGKKANAQQCPLAGVKLPHENGSQADPDHMGLGRDVAMGETRTQLGSKGFTWPWDTDVVLPPLHVGAGIQSLLRHFVKQ